MASADADAWVAPLRHVRDPELREALIRLFIRAAECASEPTSDGRRSVIVLVSRRLSCTYDMLVGGGFDGFDGFDVITDRALDGGVSDLFGRRVVLLDDTIVLGTTLVDLFDRIVDLTGDKDLVTTLVAAVDDERYNPRFADRLRLDPDSDDGGLRRSTKELEAFAFDIASCLYRAGVPYFTDFPVCAPVSTSTEALLELLRSDRWFAADVSAPAAFAGPTRRAWTLVPRAEAADRIRACGVDVPMSMAEVFKVRIYASVEGSEAKGVRIVPIGIPGAVAAPRLDTLLHALREEIGLDVRCDGWRPPAKHRLVQMYLSSCLLAELWPELDGLGFNARLDHSALEGRPLDTYFGRADAEIIRSMFDAAVQAYDACGRSTPPERIAPLRLRSGLGRRPEVRRQLVISRLMIDATDELAAAGRLSLLASAVAPRRPEPGTITQVDPFWALHLLLVFGFVDRELERKQEENLRTYDHEQYVRYRLNNGDNRTGPRVLKQGISMFELTAMLLPDIDASDGWCASLISLAIDLGNDLGIVVPTTLVDPAGVVSRQFRSGETAYLASGGLDDLARHLREDLSDGNPLCRAILDDIAMERSDAYEAFSADLDLIVPHALPGELVQAWQGEVTERISTGIRATVESRLFDGETDIAELSTALIGDDERMNAGTRFDWLVWRARDAVGKPELIARVRIGAAAPSDD